MTKSVPIFSVETRSNGSKLLKMEGSSGSQKPVRSASKSPTRGAGDSDTSYRLRSLSDRWSQPAGPRRETKVSKKPKKNLASDSDDDFVPPGTKGSIRVTRQKSREVAAQKSKKKSEMDAKVSSEDSGLGAQSLPSISAGNLHSLSSDSILASVHMSFTLKLNVNFRELKKEGHFHYKNFLRALK